MRTFIWVLLWALIVLILCVMPPDQLEGTSLFPGIDKLAHTGFFFVFSVLLFDAFIRRRSKRKGRKHSFWSQVGMILQVVMISVFFALLTELLQWKIFTYRTAEIWDLLANFVGIGMGCFAFLVLRRSK